MKCGEKDLKEQQQFIMFLPGIPTQTLPRGQKQMLYICTKLIFYNLFSYNHDFTFVFFTFVKGIQYFLLNLKMQVIFESFFFWAFKKGCYKRYLKYA